MVRSISQHEDLIGGDAMLGAVAFSAQHLLLLDDWNDAIEDVLLRLGVAAGVSRSYLIRVDRSEAGDHLATQLAEWCAPGVTSQLEDPTLQEASLVASGFSRWIALMTDRETVHGVVRELPDSERQELERQEIVSIAVFPVFVDGAWWGFIGFDDCFREREWTPRELDPLRAVAGMVGAAVQRQRSEHQRLEAEAKYQQLVREAEARYRAMVELIPAVTYTDLVGDDGATVMGFVSPQMEGILGYPPDRFLEDPGLWYELIQPDDLAYLRSIDAFDNTDLRPFDHEYRMLHADGHWVWVHDTSTAVLDADGSLAYFLGFLTDVSRLRDAHEHLRLMVDASLDAIVTMDVEGVITGWNPQAETTFGWTAEEAIGRSWAETIVPHAQRAAHVEGLRRWVRTGAGQILNSRIEVQALHRDGRLIPVELAIIPVGVGDETVFSGFIRDISERKRAQEDLERALEVEREATRRLRALDEMKDTFLQAVSHDLRTPLAAILGMAITLERGHVGLSEEETRHLAGRIEHNARRLERLVTNLLDLDRLGRGVLTPTFEPTDIGELVRRMVAESDPTMPGQIRSTIGSVIVPADPAKVERIVENLLVNAVRHTPSGTTVHVSVTGDDDGATIAVEDEGAGVPDELRDGIFEEFRRGTDAPQASPGVGVGLALVRRFAEMHEGRAWVEEREGGGASFRVFLPRKHLREGSEA